MSTPISVLLLNLCPAFHPTLITILYIKTSMYNTSTGFFTVFQSALNFSSVGIGMGVSIT